MRLPRPPAVALTLAAALSACGGEVAPPPRPPVAPAVTPPDEVVDKGVLAHLRAAAPETRRAAAQAIAARGTTATRRAASARLVAEAQEITSPAWRETSRAMLLEADRQASFTPTPAQIEAQIDRYRNEVLGRVLEAMEVVGGPEVVAYCLGLGADETAPATLRKVALAVLIAHADRNDPAIRARCAAIWERVKALPDEPSSGGATQGRGSVTNAAQVVASMAAGFRRCYEAGLQTDPEMKGSVRVTAKVDAMGAVADAHASGAGLSPAVVSCIVARVYQAVFSPPEGGAATVVIPITFGSR